MALSTGSPSGVSAEINVTPLIDVLLVLLIIFMVIVPVMPRGVSALVPQPPKEHVTVSPEQPIVVQVKAAPGGGVFYALNQQEMSRTALLGEMGRLLATRQDKVMFVRGDRDVQFSEVADVIGMGHAANADRIGILTTEMQAGR